MNRIESFESVKSIVFPYEDFWYWLNTIFDPEPPFRSIFKTYSGKNVTFPRFVVWLMLLTRIIFFTSVAIKTIELLQWPWKWKILTFRIINFLNMIIEKINHLHRDLTFRRIDLRHTLQQNLTIAAPTVLKKVSAIERCSL